MKIGNVIASTIALCWGLAVIVHYLTQGSAHSGGAFGAGQFVGTLLALALGLAGARGLVREIQRNRAS